MSTSSAATAAAPATRRAAWVSKGLETLERAMHAAGGVPSPPIDVLIVGSGYGGAVAADRLAGCLDANGRPLRIVVLERGREYLPGTFPSTLSDVATHVRFTTPGATAARGRLEGLFDIRVGADVSVICANGVGGGSLINAGVMLPPRPEVFADAAWPAAIDADDVLRRAGRLQHELGAAPGNTVGDDTFGAPLARAQGMERLGRRARGGEDAWAVPIAMALECATTTCADVVLNKCVACGDCATGCNHGAKNSLDVNLLRRAQRKGVEIYTGATVARLAPDGDGWVAQTWHTDLALRRRAAGALAIRARRIILAAGTLGSTDILMRSRSNDLPLSTRLGSRFSANGDVLATLFDSDVPLGGVAREEVRPSARRVGPTITRMLDWRDADPLLSCVVQDLAVPATLRRVFEEMTATAHVMHRLPIADDTVHAADDNQADLCAVDSAKVARSCAVAVITRDSAAGVMHLVHGAGTDLDAGLEVDPGLRIDWPGARDDPRIAAAHSALGARMRRTIRGELLPNPLWRLVPEALGQTLGVGAGPLLTVHPLGGCPMADTVQHGVVDPCGRVFDADPARAPGSVHDGLVVLDGAIVPTSLGINPALTIAALADRAIEHLKREWGLQEGDVPPPELVQRPYTAAGLDKARPSVPTRVQALERLTGWVELDGRLRFVELSLAYEPMSLAPQDVTVQGQTLTVSVDPELSRLRVFDGEPGALRERSVDLKYDEAGDDQALLVVPIDAGSTLTFLRRSPSSAVQRRCRGLRAWFLNRGARDIMQQLLNGDGGGDRSALFRDLPGYLRRLNAMASRAGELRAFDYRLTLGAPSRAEGEFAGWSSGAALVGHKQLTYGRRSSPWAQLMQMDITTLGALRVGSRRRIDVSLSYFARMNVPLVRITDQRDQPAALVDLASFLLYLVRLLILIHLWSFRKPDTPLDRRRQRLPGVLEGLPAPEIHELAPADGRGGVCRLTRYRRDGTRRPPVLMIHGYSASGTTFAHPALTPGLARHVWQHGAEPWVLDLRSSAGMPTALKPWSFEALGYGDITTAVHAVCNACAVDQIDVVSHCMGSAMFAMAVLGPDARVRPAIRRWVMTQVGPDMYFTPANVLRAYVLQYVRHLLPQLDYPINNDVGRTGADADLYDRLLASLPYLGSGADSEFDIENPSWLTPWRTTPWVRTRHRLDALIGRTFDARRVSREVLGHIDDFFGDLNLQTVAQTIYFARGRRITDRVGDPTAFDDNWHRLRGLPMLSLHARDNGLADGESLLVMQRLLAQLERDHGTPTRPPSAARLIDGGHQDALIGTRSDAVFALIDRFLDD